MSKDNIVVENYPIRLKLDREQRKALKQAALDRECSVVTFLSDLVKQFLRTEGYEKLK